MPGGDEEPGPRPEHLIIELQRDRKRTSQPYKISLFLFLWLAVSFFNLVKHSIVRGLGYQARLGLETDTRGPIRPEHAVKLLKKICSGL